MNSLRSTSNAFQPSFSGLSPSEYSSAGSGSGDPLAWLAEKLEQRPFTTEDSLRVSLEQRRQAFYADQTRDQYLVFTKYCRFSFNAETGILIAKICPNNAHESAKRAFDMLISRELHAMHPSSSWLETLSSSVKLVVTISINCESPEIILNRWELIPRRTDPRMMSPPFSVCRTAFVNISGENNATSITGESHVNGTTTAVTQLDLPFEKIVDRPPCQPAERCLSISEHRLRLFAERIWSEQGLIP
ncbi:hypothetical protein BJX66DRAFT_323311 [Aspergillus keveii]|uniref:Uncharacterized protein n=1 Tax=Aspergillus keveii TaxID=714993 RepID=A0ABR4GG73_9EURO